VDVRDVVQVMIQLMNSKISGERFVLVGENCSNKDVLCLMADGFGKPRPKIAVGKRTLWTIAGFLEILGKAFHFHPLIDRGTARSASHREYYSSLKIEKAIGFTFTPIAKCIQDTCDFLQKQKNQL
jgi:nucleoside-diphosphate-sugar epimerase